MTMPHLMNCSHSEDGWCLECVKQLHDDREYVIYQQLKIAEAQKRALMDLCWELWGSRRAMAYGPAGEKAMLKKHPWLGEAKRPSDLNSQGLLDSCECDPTNGVVRYDCDMDEAMQSTMTPAADGEYVAFSDYSDLKMAMATLAYGVRNINEEIHSHANGSEDRVSEDDLCYWCGKLEAALQGAGFDV